MKPPAESVEFLNLLIYGEPGVGKTRLAGSAADHEDTSPVLILDIEGGVISLRESPTIDVIQIRSIDKLIEVYDKLEEHKGGGYKTVVIDSLSELQKLDMKTVMEQEYNANPQRVDKDVPTQRAWGKSQERLRRIIRGFKDLPVHTIMTAKVTSVTDEQTNVTHYYPAFPGKMRGDAPGFFDVVGYMRIREEQNGKVRNRVLQIAASSKVVAKDRTDSLGIVDGEHTGVVINPTIPDMWQVINSTNK